jgi:uncharacterized damage-inducible protein DinB
VTNLDWLGRLYDSVFWANERVLELPVGEGYESARRYLHHILAAERVWLLRLRGEESAGEEIWPHLSDVEARAMAAENRTGYRRFLERLTEDGLDTAIEYVNQRGRRYRTATADILIHVAMHGSYHRGQLARAVREAGAQPINTDFINYVRQLDAPDAA